MTRTRKQPRSRGSKGFNRKTAEDFLQKNRTKPGVCITDSGLQFLVVEDAAGPKPKPEATVSVHQRISLVDGTLVDDTYKKDNPEDFSLEEAIEGYREGLLMMSEGARYKFFIPPELAWGKRGAGNKIGPNALLIIDAKLIRIY